MDILFGCKEFSSLDVATKVSEITGSSFEGRDSLYHGLYYLFGRHDEESEVVVKENYDSLEGEWFEPDYVEYPVIIYVNNVDQSSRWLAAVEGVSGLVRLRCDE